MLKQIANIELQVNEWKSQWLLPNETPLEVCKEFLFQYQKYIGSIEDQVKANQDVKEEDKVSEKIIDFVEEPKPE